MTTLRTHHLSQYAIPLGRKCLLYKREKPTGKQRYTKPVFIGVQWFKNKAEALGFKAQFDRGMA